MIHPCATFAPNPKPVIKFEEGTGYVYYMHEDGRKIYSKHYMGSSDGGAVGFPFGNITVKTTGKPENDTLNNVQKHIIRIAAKYGLSRTRNDDGYWRPEGISNKAFSDKSVWPLIELMYLKPL